MQMSQMNVDAIINPDLDRVQPIPLRCRIGFHPLPAWRTTERSISTFERRGFDEEADESCADVYRSITEVQRRHCLRCNHSEMRQVQVTARLGRRYPS